MSGDELDSLLRAVSNVSRRQILKLVWRKSRSAGEIAEHLDLANASVSEHLKVLRKVGLVVLERKGTWWFYRANRKTMKRLTQLMQREFPQRTAAQD